MSYIISISHALLDIFAGGRSNVKVYLFFVYFAVLFLITFLVKRNLSEKTKKISQYLFLSTIIAGHILGSIVFLNFAHQYGFEKNDFVLTFNNGEVSSSQLSHNHVLKGSVGLGLNHFDSGKFENIDAGLPFVGIIPGYILWVGIILVLLAAFSSLVFFATLISQRTNLSKKVIFLVAFAFAAFPLIKAISDGGLFLSNTLPILAALFYGIYNSKNGKKLCVITSALYVAWTIIAWKYFFFEEDYQLKAHILASIIPFTILMTLFVVEKHATRRVSYLLGIVLVLSIIYYPMYTELSTISKYREHKAVGGIVALYSTPTDFPGTFKSSLGGLNFYEINENILVDDVINKYYLLDNIYPVAVPWKTCIPTTFGDEYTFSVNVKSDQVIDLENKIKLSQFNKTEVKFVEEKDGISKYDAAVTIKPCLPRHLNVMQEYLKSKFVEPFFVYNINKI